MKKPIIFALSCLLSLNAYCAEPKDDYDTLKKSIVKQFEKQTPKEWGENVKGVKTQLVTKQKTIAITLDACGSPHGMAYDSKLIAYLEKNEIPATLFINARWIDTNLETFKKLAANPLFEIGNHGMAHKPASVSGESAYGLKGTANVEELVDEIEQSARKIQSITNKRPIYFRSGTAYYDEVAVSVANKLNHQVVGFSILGDAGATYSTKKVKEAFLKAKKGEIAIIHMNHPESQTAIGTIEAIKELKKEGFRFVRLSDYKLK